MKKFFLFEALFFLLAQILGILVAGNIIFNLKLTETSGPSLPHPPVSFSEFSVERFLIAIIITAGFFFLVLNFKKGKVMIFRIIFLLVTFLGGTVFFTTFFPFYISLFLTLIFIFFWFKNGSLLIHNFLLTIAVAGIGGVVGISLSPSFVLFLLFILSIHDIIAVYKTKHMIKLANLMVESRALLGIIIPLEIKDFRKKLKDVRIGEKEQNFFILGSGDIIFPLVLASSVLLQGIANSSIIIIFSLVGLLFCFWLFTKLGRKPMPALPPIALFSFFGYLFSKAI